MHSPHEQESHELQYTRENIERVERILNAAKKKLEFETKEQKNRDEQLKRRQASQLQKTHALLARQLTAFQDVAARAVTQAESALEMNRKDMQRLEAQLAAARQKFERETKDKTRPATSKTPDRTPQSDQKRNPEILQIQDQIQQLNQRLRTNQAKVQRLREENVRKEDNFRRSQKREIEKITQQQEREQNSFDDTWKRAKTALENEIKEQTNMLTRYKNDYATKERDLEIELRRRHKMESERRAQHGDDAARTNYATPGKQNSIDPNDASRGTNNSRAGKARW